MNQRVVKQMRNINRIAYWHVTGLFAKMRVVVECAGQERSPWVLDRKMAAAGKSLNYQPIECRFFSQ